VVSALWLSMMAEGAGATPKRFAIRHDECEVFRSKAPVVAPGSEPAVRRLQGGRSVGITRHAQPARIT